MSDAPVEFSLGHFPETAAVKEECGLPWGVSITPFTPLTAFLDEDDALTASRVASSGVSPNDVARCEECYAFINPFCRHDYRGWRCSLCGTRNSMAGASGDEERYAARSMSELKLPELVYPVLEFELNRVEVPRVPVAVRGDEASEAAAAVARARARPQIVHILLVDLAADVVALELVKRALLEAIDGLDDTAWVGIVAVSHRVALFDLRADQPHALRVAIPADAAEAGDDLSGTARRCTAVPLGDVLPLADMVVQIASSRHTVVQAIDSLRPEGEERGFGSALVAVAHMLAQEFEGGGLAGARIHGFLGGRPNHGVGKLGNRDGETDFELQLPQVDTYAEVGALCATHGVSIDLMCVVASPRPREGPRDDIHGVLDADGGAAGGGAKPAARAPIDAAEVGSSAPDGPLPLPKGVQAPPAKGSGGGAGEFKGAEDVAALPAVERPTGDASAARVASADAVFLDLASLAPVCARTGGVLARYNVELCDSARRLQRDVETRLTAPTAWQCLLRLRCSEGFRLASRSTGSSVRGRWYGPGQGDSRVEDVWHIAACDEATTVSGLFEFDSGAGFSSTVLPPTLQVVLQYTTIVRESSEGDDSGDEDTDRQYIARRTRVLTFRAEVENLPENLYRTASRAAVVSLIMHQALDVAEFGEGTAEARLLLRDWFTHLVSCYASNSRDFERRGNPDTQFRKCAPLQLTGQHIFGLLKCAALAHAVTALASERSALERAGGVDEAARASPLVSHRSLWVHPDVRAQSRVWLSSAKLVPRMRTVYPHLATFGQTFGLVKKRLHLTNTAIAASGDPVAYFDAGNRLLVYYGAAAASLELPPDPESALARTQSLALMRGPLSPELSVFRTGTSAAARELHFVLVEDACRSDEGSTGLAPDGTGHGYARFAEAVAAEAAATL